MPKVMMMCGKLCSGKSTRAERLRKENRAVVLSVDEIMLALFGPDAGAKHDEYVARLQSWLFGKSLEILDSGVDVILDWGFWTRKLRDSAVQFYAGKGIDYEFHYIAIDDEEWRRRIDRRNQAVLAGQSGAYYVDEGLAAKFQSVFEPPEAEETDRHWVCS
ncbi:MAG: ATP-binding protein [Clostridia bacterium]|nr:ATP-binding protein [Clostridia bacterium]